MTLGVVARADEGGLGTLTQEVVRHLRPDAVLVVAMGRVARGHEDVDRLDAPAVHVAPFPLTGDAARWCYGHADVWYHAETFYDSSLATAGRSVLHVMPELARRAEMRCATQVWTPTSWRIENLRGLAAVDEVPVPVALDRFPERVVTQARRFLHIAGPAMLDRHGTDLVCAAAELTGPGVEWRHLHHGPGQALPTPTDYADIYADADVLVAPRRYGGLSLVAQEAMAAGLVLVTLDRQPEDEWPTVRVPTTRHSLARMAGGVVPVAEADPAVLARTLDTVSDIDPSTLSRRSRAWAEEHSWAAHAPRWRERLAAVAR